MCVSASARSFSRPRPRPTFGNLNCVCDWWWCHRARAGPATRVRQYRIIGPPFSVSMPLRSARGQREEARKQTLSVSLARAMRRQGEGSERRRQQETQKLRVTNPPCNQCPRGVPRGTQTEHEALIDAGMTDLTWRVLFAGTTMQWLDHGDAPIPPVSIHHE